MNKLSNSNLIKNLILSPFGIYLGWVIILFSFVLCIPLLTQNYDTSAQVPFIFITYSLVTFIFGLFIISFSNLFLFKDWVKQYWYINNVILIVSIGLIVFYIIKIIGL
mgnify:CR=1 FL=1|tara:strand:- start:31554 stop:31877 length:324 start_codon:yes stop_codon:yes gene_type:complete